MACTLEASVTSTRMAIVRKSSWVASILHFSAVAWAPSRFVSATAIPRAPASAKDKTVSHPMPPAAWKFQISCDGASYVLEECVITPVTSATPLVCFVVMVRWVYSGLKRVGIQIDVDVECSRLNLGRGEKGHGVVLRLICLEFRVTGVLINTSISKCKGVCVNVRSATFLCSPMQTGCRRRGCHAITLSYKDYWGLRTFI